MNGDEEDDGDDDVISSSNTNGGIKSHIAYLSKLFGKETFESLTTNFINHYSMVLHQQLVMNRKMELSKSKLITDFVSCQLLVDSGNDFTHIANLIRNIRK